LARHFDQSPRANQAARDDRPPKDAIRQFIEEIIQRSLSDPERRGCLLINSALEIATHDRELGAALVVAWPRSRRSSAGRSRRRRSRARFGRTLSQRMSRD
jgi:hypothetical protein